MVISTSPDAKKYVSRRVAVWADLTGCNRPGNAQEWRNGRIDGHQHGDRQHRRSVGQPGGQELTATDARCGVLARSGVRAFLLARFRAAARRFGRFRRDRFYGKGSRSCAARANGNETTPARRQGLHAAEDGNQGLNATLRHADIIAVVEWKSKGGASLGCRQRGTIRRATRSRPEDGASFLARCVQ